MAVATDREHGLFIGGELIGPKQSGFGRELGLETLELDLETKSVIVSTGSRPIDPFGLA